MEIDIVMQEQNNMIKKLGIYEIIWRKVQYIEKDEVYQDEEMLDVKKGRIKAYEEILCDIRYMQEQKFINKYIDKLKNLAKVFDDEIDVGEDFDDRKIAELSGYNNTIVEILSLFNPKYEFELE